MTEQANDAECELPALQPEVLPVYEVLARVDSESQLPSEDDAVTAPELPGTLAGVPLLFYVLLRLLSYFADPPNRPAANAVTSDNCNSD